MPLSLRYILIVGSLLLTLVLLYLGRNIFISAYMGLLFAFLMIPFSNRLEKRGCSRKLAAMISMVIVLSCILLLIYFFITRVRGLTSDVEEISRQLDAYRRALTNTLHTKYNIAESDVEQFYTNAKSAITRYFSGFGSIASSFIIASVVLPMTMYFIMIYRKHYKEFLFKVFPSAYHSGILETYQEEVEIVKRYLLGVMGVVLILSVCNVTALTIIGIEHALLFGVLAGLLNIIPVFGSLIGSALPVIYAIATKDSLWYPFIVAIYFLIIQLLESSLITPNIVGSKMKVNPYAIILAVFIGGTVWGPPGMVFFIPLLAQLKCLLQHIEPLQPYGFLLSDPATAHKESFFKKIIFKKNK